MISSTVHLNRRVFEGDTSVLIRTSAVFSKFKSLPYTDFLNYPKIAVKYILKQWLFSSM